MCTFYNASFFYNRISLISKIYVAYSVHSQQLACSTLRVCFHCQAWHVEHGSHFVPNVVKAQLVLGLVATFKCLALGFYLMPTNFALLFIWH